jgi:hypothetical protein
MGSWDFASKTGWLLADETEIPIECSTRWHQATTSAPLLEMVSANNAPLMTRGLKNIFDAGNNSMPDYRSLCFCYRTKNKKPVN